MATHKYKERSSFNVRTGTVGDRLVEAYLLLDCLIDEQFLIFLERVLLGLFQPIISTNRADTYVVYT